MKEMRAHTDMSSCLRKKLQVTSLHRPQVLLQVLPPKNIPKLPTQYMLDSSLTVQHASGAMACDLPMLAFL